MLSLAFSCSVHSFWFKMNKKKQYVWYGQLGMHPDPIWEVQKGSMCRMHTSTKCNESREWSQRGALTPLGSLEQVLRTAEIGLWSAPKPIKRQRASGWRLKWTWRRMRECAPGQKLMLPLISIRLPCAGSAHFNAITGHPVTREMFSSPSRDGRRYAPNCLMCLSEWNWRLKRFLCSSEVVFLCCCLHSCLTGTWWPRCLPH